MTRSRIARLLHLGDGRYATKPITETLRGYGPTTKRFSLVGEGMTIEDVGELAGRRADPEDRRARALHTLAVSVHADRRFQSALGRPLAWPGYLLLELLPHGRTLPRLDPDRNQFAHYSSTANSGVIRFESSEDGIHACLSSDICVHEVVHALLHAARGWIDADRETRAVAECIGDTFSMLLAADHQEIRKAALASSPDLTNSNLLSLFADLPDGRFLRDASRALHWDDVDRQDSYAMAKVVGSALYGALRRTFAILAPDMGPEKALSEAVLRLSRAVLGAIDSLPPERVRIRALAREVTRRAEPDLAEALGRAWEEAGIDASPAEEAAVLRSLASVGVDPEEVVGGLERELGGVIELCGLHEQQPRARAMFPLAGQRTHEFVWRSAGSTRTGCLTTDLRGNATALSFS
ncbi:MAG: hypothetical protein AAGI22_00150 [Planctomycetota bacterium]